MIDLREIALPPFNAWSRKTPEPGVPDALDYAPWQDGPRGSGDGGGGGGSITEFHNLGTPAASTTSAGVLVEAPTEDEPGINARKLYTRDIDQLEITQEGRLIRIGRKPLASGAGAMSILVGSALVTPNTWTYVKVEAVTLTFCNPSTGVDETGNFLKIVE